MTEDEAMAVGLVEEYIMMCRKHGVIHLRLGGMEFELQPPAAKPPPDIPERKLSPEEQQAADDDVMFHSSDP